MVLFDLVYAGAGFVLGAFTPAVGRKIKSWFVKETKVAAPTVTAAVAAVKADAAVVEKKL